MKKRSAKEWANIALIGGGVLVAFLVGRKVLQFLNIVPTQEEAKQSRQRKETLKDAQKKLTIKPTKSDFYWQALADTIHDAWKYSRFDDDKELAENKLKEVKNDADYLKLVEFYGRRQNYFFGIPEGGLRTLSEAANSELSQSRLDRINAQYQKQKMKYRI